MQSVSEIVPFLGAIIRHCGRSTTLGNSSPIFSSRYSKSRIAVKSAVFASLAQGSSGTAISTAEPLGAAIIMRRRTALWWETTRPAVRGDAGPRETQSQTSGMGNRGHGAVVRHVKASESPAGSHPDRLMQRPGRHLPKPQSRVLSSAFAGAYLGSRHVVEARSPHDHRRRRTRAREARSVNRPTFYDLAATGKSMADLRVAASLPRSVEDQQGARAGQQNR